MFQDLFWVVFRVGLGSRSEEAGKSRKNKKQRKSGEAGRQRSKEAEKQKSVEAKKRRSKEAEEWNSREAKKQRTIKAEKQKYQTNAATPPKRNMELVKSG